MAFSIMQIARTLGHVSGWSLSNLQMQKIAFIAEMLHLGRTDAPLVNENWQAWSYGPVQPDLYHRAKVFGADPVKDIFLCPTLPSATASGKSVRDAYDAMRDLAPGEMIDITHQPGGAWASAYRPGKKSVVIPKTAIRDEYETLITDD